MPVEEETEGGTPILSITGLKMAPPPRPSAPDTHPPKNAYIVSLLTTVGTYIKSVSQIPLAYFILSNCSLLAIVRAANVTVPHIHKYSICKNQSKKLQDSMPKIESKVLLPLANPTNT